MAGSKGLEGLRSNGTDCGGPGYIHPRSDKYRDNYDSIFRKEEEEACPGGCGANCCKLDPRAKCCGGGTSR